MNGPSILCPNCYTPLPSSHCNTGQLRPCPACATDVQAQVFRALGMSDEEAREKFGFFLDALKYGTPPHGGIALGLDRIVMLLAGAKSLREVIAFPKVASGSDLMTDSPSAVSQQQLDELKIKPLV